jgi:hypothetical protein
LGQTSVPSVQYLAIAAKLGFGSHNVLSNLAHAKIANYQSITLLQPRVLRQLTELWVGLLRYRPTPVNFRHQLFSPPNCVADRADRCRYSLSTVKLS